MKSSLKISVTALGLISAVLISAAASTAADKIAAVDYIVEETPVMAGQNEFFEELETDGFNGVTVLNDFEILEIEDEALRPTDNPQKPQSSTSSKAPTSSKKPQSSSAQSVQSTTSVPASSQGSSSKKPSSSQTGTSSSTTSSAPTTSQGAATGEVLTFKANGATHKLPVKEALKKVVSNELDGNFKFEAIKAQVVATHTYIKYYNDSGTIPSVGMKDYKVGGTIDKAVEEVYNEIMTYNGKAIYSPYFALSCGKTQASKEVWGGARAYLVSAESKYDYLADYYNLSKKTYTSSKIYNRYLVTKTISEATVSQKIKDKCGFTPSGDPSTWFKELSYTSGGYVNQISICGKSTTTGKNIRSWFSLRSADFDITYKNGNFTFTTRGYGHGVGMSQWGAHFYADKEGWNYRQILSHYYKGISFKTVS
ncbi:MAG: SpoIID/LytB domain-containing protein [Ruminococcaceae bacterium]|nr:SpoIID/LytB domain-containing protein [Oscillospiraceae bacterium]